MNFAKAGLQIKFLIADTSATVGKMRVRVDTTKSGKREKGVKSTYIYKCFSRAQNSGIDIQDGLFSFYYPIFSTQ